LPPAILVVINPHSTFIINHTNIFTIW